MKCPVTKEECHYLRCGKESICSRKHPSKKGFPIGREPSPGPTPAPIKKEKRK